MNFEIELCSDIGIAECSYDYVSKELAKYKDKPINVRIDSPGGYADDGFRIMQAFREHGHVTVYLQNLVASAATIISMGAEKIIISPYTHYLIHNCSSFVLEWSMMNQDQLRECIKDLKRQLTFNETLDHMAACLYADRCGKDVKEMAKLMSKAEWLTAEQVVELGLADEIGEELKCRRQMTTQMKAHLHAYGYPELEGVEFAAFDADALLNDSFVSKFAAKLASIFNPHPVLPLKADPDTNFHKETMNKTFTTVMALLALEAIAFVDGKANVTEEQMKSIEEALKEAQAKDSTIESLNNKIKDLQTSVDASVVAKTDFEKQINDLKAQMAEKDQQIEALKKSPGAASSTVLQQGNATLDLNKPEDAMRIAQALVNARKA